MMLKCIKRAEGVKTIFYIYAFKKILSGVQLRNRRLLKACSLFLMKKTPHKLQI